MKPVCTGSNHFSFFVCHCCCSISAPLEFVSFKANMLLGCGELSGYVSLLFILYSGRCVQKPWVSSSAQSRAAGEERDVEINACGTEYGM